MELKKYPIVLTIAGSDSIGGAGIQADIKTCCAFGVYAMSAITAVTAQSSAKVHDFISIDKDLLCKQLRVIIEDERPDAVKIGMLPNIESISSVIEIINKYNLSNIVIDPVMVATSGDRLTYDSESHKGDVMKQLISMADILTPNIIEAEYLCSRTILNVADMETVAKMILNNFKCKSVLLKGGHLKCDESIDLYMEQNGSKHYFRNNRINSANTHGTGCSLSSAIAAGLSKGETMYSAVENGIEFIHDAIERGKNYKFGIGHGSINHLFKIQDYVSEGK